jgi:hypothetical protein
LAELRDPVPEARFQRSSCGGVGIRSEDGMGESSEARGLLQGGSRDGSEVSEEALEVSIGRCAVNAKRISDAVLLVFDLAGMAGGAGL